MRKKKWLRRGAYFLIFLALVYLLFWWALFNPLESDVESLVALVPKDVNYMIHSPWGKLRGSDLFQKGFLESSLKEEIDFNFQLDEFLYAPIRDLESQINQSVPGFFGEFSILEDFAGREVLIAGHLTGDGQNIGEKIGNSPYLALTRISFKAKFIEALKHGFVRDKIPGLTSYPAYFRFDLGEQYVREGAPPEARFVYFSRIRDVLAVSNNQDLIQKVVSLGVAGDDQGASQENLPGGNYWFYYDIYAGDNGEQGPTQEPGVTVWLRVRRADRDLGNAIGGGRDPRNAALPSIVRIFFPVGLTNSLTLQLGADGADRIPIRGKIRMDDRTDLPKWIARFHQSEDLEMKPSLMKWSEYATEKGTFVFAWLGMDVERAFLTFFKSLDGAKRRLWFGEGDPNRDPETWTDEDAADRLGEWFEDGICLSLARLPEADTIDLERYDGREMDPLPASTVYLELLEGLEPQSLIDFFQRNHERLGSSKMEEIESPIGRMFTLAMPGDMSDKLRKPAFAMIDQSFIWSTNIDQLRRILAAKATGSGTLAQTPEFRAAAERARDKGKLFLYSDVPGLHRFLMDLRHEVAYDAVQFDAVKFRALKRLELKDKGWDDRQAEEEVDRLMAERERTMRIEEFPEALSEYKRAISWLSGFGWMSLAGNVSGDPSGAAFMELRGVLTLSGSKKP